MDTSDFIEALVRTAAPVKRLTPPGMRAAQFLLACAALLLTVTLAANAWPGMLVRLQDTRFALEMVATSLTGITAVTTAFLISVPDRSTLWMVLPLPPLLAWLATSGFGCYRNWFAYGADGSLAFGRSADCVVFILGVGIPLATALFLALRRASPLTPSPVMAIGALGGAALAATALQFFHPFDVTVADLALHATAVIVVILLTVTFGAPRLGPRLAIS